MPKSYGIDTWTHYSRNNGVNLLAVATVSDIRLTKFSIFTSIDNFLTIAPLVNISADWLATPSTNGVLNGIKMFGKMEPESSNIELVIENLEPLPGHPRTLFKCTTTIGGDASTCADLYTDWKTETASSIFSSKVDNSLKYEFAVLADAIQLNTNSTSTEAVCDGFVHNSDVEIIQSPYRDGFDAVF